MFLKPLYRNFLHLYLAVYTSRTASKMRPLLIFLAVLAAAFATPEFVNEWPSWLGEEQLNLDEPFEGTVQQDGGGQNIFQAGKIYLFLGVNNKFLSSINHGGPGGENYLQSIKLQQDQFCRFAASVLDDGTIAFKDFEGNGKYLQLDPSQRTNSVRPTGNAIDDTAKFQVEVGPDGPWKGAHYVYLKASNGRYWGLIKTGGPVPNNISAHFSRNVHSVTRFIVLEAN